MEKTADNLGNPFSSEKSKAEHSLIFKAQKPKNRLLSYGIYEENTLIKLKLCWKSELSHVFLLGIVTDENEIKPRICNEKIRCVCNAFVYLIPCFRHFF